MATIFTKIIQGEIPGYIVAENEEFCAFLDAFPVQYGHTLVVPKREEDYLFELTDEELGRMMVFAKKVAAGIQKATGCRKVGMAVIGLEVPHAHIHLVPITQERDMDFNHKISEPEKAKMVEMLEKIKSNL
ncbi:HIT family protein [Porphyromonas levii]|uniref:HIT family protein n=2 Tax=Porphyromonas levii TaxID=28114 RepID=A0A4Y8WM91_9PORP|nr:HIT family protein [Porphyromonas levii]MBR8702508.1 putative HIT-like protein [Porphyromonas levii]MBR8713171.1 putative HIT-like protein [Porphyromonas levii]MBR8714634.1 putative HIT-like protein [Porphyromonas levii]MBR8727702.1 putative HIT-like protein [Porphyromonas levii]MBR8731601.1 putative HIT-like protein [Porphyromonas levii]